MNKTLAYYEQNAKSYIEDTVNVSFDIQRNFFLKYLPAKSKILDLGCGSGRDSKAFIEQGYTVCAVDGSNRLCEFASAFIGQPVRNLLFTQLDYVNEFDGIWACSSLLHLSIKELYQVLPLLIKACNKNAIIYMSFKYGDFEGYKGERYFTYMNEKKFRDVIQDYPLKIIEESISSDVRKNRETENWYNVILKTSKL